MDSVATALEFVNSLLYSLYRSLRL